MTQTQMRVRKDFETPKPSTQANQDKNSTMNVKQHNTVMHYNSYIHFTTKCTFILVSDKLRAHIEYKINNYSKISDLLKY